MTVCDACGKESRVNKLMPHHADGDIREICDTCMFGSSAVSDRIMKAAVEQANAAARVWLQEKRYART